MSYDEEKFSRPECNPSILASTSQIDLYQSLDDILEGLKKTLNDIPPPKSSRKEFFSKWEFIKGIQKEDILELVKKINKLSNNEIHERVKEIEQVAYKLDLEQAQEFKEGDNMKFMKR